MQTFNQLFFKKKQIFSYFFKEISDSKGETITITYPDDTNSDKNYKIFSASGQLVYSQISQSNSISVPSSSLPPGMNIVYVSIHGETFEASKIIVR